MVQGLGGVALPFVERAEAIVDLYKGLGQDAFVERSLFEGLDGQVQPTGSFEGWATNTVSSKWTSARRQTGHASRS